MQAKLLAQCSETTAVYEVDPPMSFLKPIESPNDLDELVEFDLITIYSGEITQGYARSVIHATKRLKGGEGTEYGVWGSRVLDGVADQVKALELSGYKVVKH